jgi:hypothetical protein
MARQRAVRAVRRMAGAVILSACGAACDVESFSSPTRTSCAEIGAQCQLPDGPLGVCLDAPCAAGAAPPCFKCVSQH